MAAIFLGGCNPELSTPKSEDSAIETIPKTINDPEWTRRYSPDIPYYNRSGEAVPAFKGANPQTAFIGLIEPDHGGFIQSCALSSSFCKITFSGGVLTGYVDMNRLSGEAR